MGLLLWIEAETRQKILFNDICLSLLHTEAIDFHSIIVHVPILTTSCKLVCDRVSSLVIITGRFVHHAQLECRSSKSDILWRPRRFTRLHSYPNFRRHMRRWCYSAFRVEWHTWEYFSRWRNTSFPFLELRCHIVNSGAFILWQLIFVSLKKEMTFAKNILCMPFNSESAVNVSIHTIRIASTTSWHSRQKSKDW